MRRAEAENSFENYKEPIKYLEWLRPGGPWVLTAIIPDGAATTVTASKPAEVLAFIRKHDGKRNLYYSVNPVRGSVKKKAAKADITAIEFLQLDLDPRDDETPDMAKARYREAIEDCGLPVSAVVDSGNGIQGLIRLVPPIHLPEPVLDAEGKWKLTPEAENIKDGAEARSEAAMKRLGADAGTQNIDRILRIPGTINLPNKTKRKAGRIPCPTKTIYMNGATARLEDLPLPEAKTEEPKPKPTGEGGTLPPLAASLLSVRGSGAYPSRSELLFAFLTAALRGRVADETIIEACLDHRYEGCGIFEHCREKDQPSAYVARQVAKAKENSAELTEMNDRFAVVPYGGKARILTFESEGEHELPVFYTASDFKLLLSNRKVSMPDGKPKLLAEWWLAHRDRRQYAGVTFAPGEPAEVDGRLNLWKGWGVEPREGVWRRFRAHIEERLSAGNAAYADYIIKWTAWSLQNPGLMPEVALVSRGGKGTGKGVFGRALCKIFGQHGLQISSSRHLTGNFNRHLQDCAFLFADEAFWPGDKAAEGTLKRIITEPTLFIEPKGVDGWEELNHLHIYMAANADWVVPASHDERRYAMFDVAETRKGDRTYFEKLYQEIKNGGIAAMMHDLLTMDLKGWHPRNDVPQTEALIEQKLTSLDGFDDWWVGLLAEGVLPRAKKETPTRAYSSDLFEHARRTVPRLKFASDHWLGRHLRKKGCSDFKEKKGPRGWEFPPLAEARRKWNARIPTKWDDPKRDWIPESM